MGNRNYYLQCPYCNARKTREDLVSHIEEKHNDELPKGFTPLQVVYHVANKRDFGNPRKCRICKRPTPWDENKGRYDQLCGRPECKKMQAKSMTNDMGDKLRSNSPTQSVEGLEKMLGGRRISGKYTWGDGTVFTYTGTYEYNFLKWMDEVMQIKSEDLMCPGPAMTYMYEGEEHIYIPDFLYIPYNAIIEIKDGGHKKNTSEARRDSRMKTIAKEKHIIKNTNYHYIRLTDNDFSQLLAFFSDLKMHLIDNDKEQVVHINEHMTHNLHRQMVPQRVINNGVVIVNYMQNNAFLGKSGIAVANSKDLDPIYAIDKMGKLKKYTAQVLGECTYTPYVVCDCKDRVMSFIEENIGKEVTDDQLYEVVFGHKRYSEDQLVFEDTATAYKDYYYQLIKGGKRS